MKTLKKVMAMTLAFATAMTMFVSASAFTDDADIQHEEAVGALSSLGIIKGNSDGSFAPKKTVTRGEMAKMIYVLRTGKDDGATAYSGLSTTFTDIANTWAQPYIKYCYSLGIINGRSATKFDPDATVTGAEAAKMLLVTMGYDPAKAGLTGSTWALQTAALGSEKGLFDDVYQDLYEALNRENAAQEIYNTLDARTVRFDGDDNAYTDQNRDGSDMKTVGEKFLDLETATGTLMVSGNVGLTSGDDDKLIIDLDSTNKDNAGKQSDFDDVNIDYSALLGQDVKVLYKTTKTTTGKKTTKVYGVYASDENTVVDAKASDIDYVSNETKIKIDGKKYSIDDELTVYTVNSTEKKIETTYTLNGTKNSDGTDIAITDTKTTGTMNADNVETVADAINDSDFEVKAISNDDNDKIDEIIIYKKNFIKLTKVNSTTVAYKTVSPTTGEVNSAAKELDLEDDTPDVYKGAAKDDYAFVGVNLFSGDNVITKADEIKGKSTASKKGEVQVNGTWYDLTNTEDANSAMDTGKEVTLYVYGTYAYKSEGTSTTNLDTLVVKSFGSYKSLDKGVEAKVIFDDGTEKVINVTDVTVNGDTKPVDSTTNYKTNKTYVGTRYEQALYEYDEDDGDYSLTLIKGESTSTDAVKYNSKLTYTANANYLKNSETIGNQDVNDDAVIYLVYTSGDSTKYKVVSGKDITTYSNLTAAADNNSVAVYDDDGICYALINTGTANASTKDSLYGVVTDAYLAKNADGDKRYYLDLITADGVKSGVETDLTEAKGSNMNLDGGDIITFQGSYTSATDVKVLSNTGAISNANLGGYAAVKNYNSSSKLVSFYGNITAGKITSDTAVIYIDMSNSDTKKWAVEEGDVIKADTDSSDNYVNNVFAYYDSKSNADDAELDLLVVETNKNEIKQSGTTAANED